MANSDRPAKTSKVIDITEPGKTAPPESARPIIVTNRPMIKQDPMVVSDETNPEFIPTAPSKIAVKVEPLEAETAKAEKIKVNKTVQTIPPEEPVPEEKTTAELSKSTTAGTVVDQPPPPAEAPAPKTDEPTAETEAPPPTSSSFSDDEVKPGDEQLAPNQVLETAQKKAEAEKAAKLAELEKLVESKKYFLPINRLEQRRTVHRMSLLLGLIVVLVLIWLDVVLDAGIVKIGGLHSLTHFFKP